MTVATMNSSQLAIASAEQMWSDDLASQGLGMAIEEIEPGRAVLSMEITSEMVNGHNIAHGGFIFTLADSAFAFSCNTYNEVTVAQGASIDFVRSAALGDQLRAEAVERSRGRSTGVYDVTVTRADGKIIACFRGKSFNLGKPILPENGDSE